MLSNERQLWRGRRVGTGLGENDPCLIEGGAAELNHLAANALNSFFKIRPVQGRKTITVWHAMNAMRLAVVHTAWTSAGDKPVKR